MDNHYLLMVYEQLLMMGRDVASNGVNRWLAYYPDVIPF